MPRFAVEINKSMVETLFLDSTVGCIAEKCEDILFFCRNLSGEHLLGAAAFSAELCFDLGQKLFERNMLGNGGEAVAEVFKAPVSSVSLRVQTDTTSLRENGTWDMATLRFQAVDQNGNVLPYCSRIVSIQVEGVLELVGDPMVALSGGMAGAYLKTTGVPGTASVTLTCQGAAPVTLDFTVEV